MMRVLCCALVFLTVVEFSMNRFRAHGGRFILNYERVGILKVDKDRSYKSWSIYYSDGLVCLPSGKTKIMWARPRYRHLELTRNGDHLKIYVNRLDPQESVSIQQ